MLLFRSLVLGLLGAVFLLQLDRPDPEVRLVPVAAPARMQDGNNVTVIDVARGVTASALPSLLGLDPGEQVTAINDEPVLDNLDAGMRLAALDPGPSRFVDLTVTRAHESRRVLVLLH